ncbi:enoyl-CoA hydratase/carnithine racemase [Paraburkholderia sp. GAS199]|uniref:enoyl-CoA hydratase/isomerase family protein n=1 Tax=Paraburkholderia sp. GAS199 TaxID=3035126 RepID=UPI003D256D02
MEELLVENHAAVRVLTMNRPAKHNALNTGLTAALVDALSVAAADDSCRAIVLAGSGKSFCAGADTSEFAALSGAGDDGENTASGQGAHAANRRADLTASLHAAFPRTAKPIVSAVQGNALGGGAGLALACDLMVVADDVRLGYPELKHGIVAAIVMANLVRQVGQKTAFGLVSTGRMLDAQAAVALGLAHDCAPLDQLRDRAIGLADQLAGWSPVAMQATKRLFYRVSNLPFEEALAVGRDTNVMMRGFGKKATQ